MGHDDVVRAFGRVVGQPLPKWREHDIRHFREVRVSLNGVGGAADAEHVGGGDAGAVGALVVHHGYAVGAVGIADQQQVLGDVHRVKLAVGVHSKGTDRLVYDWYHEDQKLPAVSSLLGTLSHLPLTLRNTNFEGAYYVIVRNLAGSATSAVWTVKIRLFGESTGWGNNSSGQLDSSRWETNPVAVAAGAAG
jgi:hypothetical protein